MIDNLRWAGIINIIVAMFYFVMGGILPFTILLIFGIYLLDLIRNVKKEVLKKNSSLLIIGVVSAFINPISAILLFWGLSKSKEREKINKKPKYNLMQMKRKVLLKLGLSIVLFAGLLIATSSSEAFSDSFRIIILLFLAGIFLFLYYLTDIKLKLKKTAFAYWNVSMVFLILALVAVGQFAIIGNHFSFDGRDQNLLIFSIFMLIAALAYISNTKLNNVIYKYIFVFAGLLALNSLFLHVNMLINIHLLIFTLFVFCLNYYDFDHKYLKVIKELLTIFVMPLLYIILAWQLASCTVFFMLALFTIVNLIYFAYNTNKNHYTDTLIPIISIIIIYVTLLAFKEISLQYIPLVFTGLLALAYLGSILFKFKESLASNTIISTNIAFLLVYITIFSNRCDLVCVAIALIIALTNLCYHLFHKKDVIVLEKYLEPVKYLMLVIAVIVFLTNKSTLFDSGSIIHCLYLLSLLPLLYLKDPFYKKVYYIMFSILFGYALLTTFEYSFIISISLMIGAVVAFVYSYKICIDDQDKLALISYYFLLITLFLQLIVNDMLRIGGVWSSLLVIAIYGLMYYKFYKNEEMKIATILLSIFPILTFFDHNVDPGILRIIITSTIYFIGIYLFDRLITLEKSLKMILTTLLIIAVILSVIFTSTPLMGIYVGLIALGLMYAGYRYDDYLHLFFIGVATTIINIMYQLSDTWTQIPFWLYLLFVGVLIIVFVTKKEFEK